MHRMDQGESKRRRLNDSDLTSLGQELLRASYSGNIYLFKDVAVLLDKGRGCLSVTVGMIRDESYGFGAIHMAAAGGNLQLLRFLIEDLSLEIDTLDGSGQSPLTYAICNGRSGIVPYLLENGASPNQPCVSGFTPFDFSVAEGQLQSIETLLNSGLVDINRSCINGTALHVAANAGNEDSLRLLLNNGANPNIKVNDFTPLTLALLAPSPKCAKLLIEAGAIVEYLHPVPPVLLSANNGLSDFMRRLVEAGANLDILYDDGPDGMPMIPFPSCSSVACNKLSRLTIGCCGRCYCCLHHLLEGHPKDHNIGLPRVLQHSALTLSIGMEVPGCVRPPCPPWWLHKISRMGDQIIYEYLCSDETIGDEMVHCYMVGHNEPMVEF